MTQEALFSCNFVLFGSDGVSHQFTVRSDILNDGIQSVIVAKSLLLANGFSPQVVAAKAGRTVQVDAACMGRFEDKKSNEYKTCIHFYGTNGKFKVATVYPEKFGDVPAYIRDAIKAAQPRTLDSAPEREKALSMKALVTFAPATIALEARTDYDGNPILSESGKPTFKFSSFAGGVGYKGDAVAADLYTPEAPAESEVPF